MLSAGQKKQQEDALWCYCFISGAMLRTEQGAPLLNSRTDRERRSTGYSFGAGPHLQQKTASGTNT